MVLGIFGKKEKGSTSNVKKSYKKGGNKKGKNRSKSKGKNKSQGMASVFNESVIETVLLDFVNNELFTIKDGNGATAYIGAVLEVDSIGGLDRKSRSDESKGSIIEGINTGRIKTLITDDLMESEQILFVPDLETVDAMAEYSLLYDATYELCRVYADGKVELMGEYKSFAELEAIHENDTPIYSSVISQPDVSSNKFGSNEQQAQVNYDKDEDDDEDYDDEDDDIDDDEDEDMPQSEFTGNASTMNEEVVQSSNDEYSDEDDDDNPFEPVAADTPHQNEYNYEDYDESGDEDDEDGYEEDYTEYSGEDEVTVTQVRDAIKRHFYSEDLGLEVSSEPFDSQFVQDNEIVLFDEDRGDGWLDGHLSQIAKDANAEMKSLHQANIFKLRDLYFKLIPLCCDNIQASLDIEDLNNKYGVMHKNLREATNTARSNAGKKVEDKKAVLLSEWNKELEVVGESAKAKAIEVHTDRYGKQHQEKLFNVELDINDSIEQDYQNLLRAINEKRKSEASVMLDTAINETLAELSATYVGMLEKEQNRRDQLQAEMYEYIETNRKADIARVELQTKALEREGQIEEINRECNEKIKQITSEFEAKRLLSEETMKQLREDHAHSIKTVERNYEERVADFKKHNRRLEGELDTIATHHKNVVEMTNERHELRVKNLENDKADLVRRHEIDLVTRKRNDNISIVLFGTAAIAAAAVGFIIGNL